MKFRPWLNLNIRQKIVLGLLLMMAGLGTMSGLAYTNLLKVERKINLVEIADDLHSHVLEIRRSEKNYFLYGIRESVDANKDYVHNSVVLLSDIAVRATSSRVRPIIDSLYGQLNTYEKHLAEILDMEESGKNTKALKEKLREMGKDLEASSKNLSLVERQEILRISTRLKENLLYSVMSLVALTVAMFFLVTVRILVPLKDIEEATTHIARGDFSPLPDRESNDEIQQVIHALNRMASELELSQDQLIQAQKLSSIGTLASGIAHQLNNPLNNISTSCQILQDEMGAVLPPIAGRMLENIEKETFRARDIVRGLLEFSREQEFALAVHPLKAVVSRAVGLVSSQVPPGVEMAVDIPDELMATLDPQRMQEALINLLMNSLQAMENGEGNVWIKGWAEDGDVLLEVGDTGKGIDQESMPRIFDPFYTSKEVGYGTGLGLYIVYGIVKQHRGSITVESEVDQGTRFHIRLPGAQDRE